MTVPGNVNELLLRTAAAAGGYSIDRSLRFNSADSAYLSRTPASAGNRKTWTWSGWIKRAQVTNAQNLFGSTSDGYNVNYSLLYFPGTQLRFEDYSASSLRCQIRTTQVFRDPSAWLHVVLAVDTTQATSTNRVKVYVNGTEVTDLSQTTYPSQNTDLFINSTNGHHISYSSSGVDGYLADIYFIDGTALTPSAFGETDATTGVWVPKTPTGLTYGTNGFHLDFADNSSAAALGYDAAGSNDWTVNNLSLGLTDKPVIYLTYTGGAVGAGAYSASIGSVSSLGSYSGDTWTATNSGWVDTWDFGSDPGVTSFTLSNWNVGSYSNQAWYLSNNSSFSSGTVTGPNSGTIADGTHSLVVSGTRYRYLRVQNIPSATYSLLGVRSSSGAGCDSLVDSPTNGTASTGGDAGGVTVGNYCTWNPLDKNASLSPTNGNLDITGVNTDHRMIRGTIGMSSGKWYWEVTWTSAGGSPFVGIAKQDASLANGQYVGANAASWGYAKYLGYKYNNGSGSSYGVSYAVNDAVGVAFDADNGTLTFYVNGSSQGSAYTGLTSGPYFPAISLYNVDDTAVLNTGARAFAYAAPSGYKALCTANLPAPTIVKPDTVMDVKLYTGNGSTQTISGLGFSPDLVWIKERSSTAWHVVNDTVRGANKGIYANSTYYEETLTNTFESFNSDGFSLAYNSNYGNVFTNRSSQTYAGWCWDAGTSNATNTSGSIQSTVRANISAGFSIVTWTGTGSAGTMGHGLGVAPQMIIVKNRSTSSDWIVGHQRINSTPWDNYYLILNSTGAVAGAITSWGGAGGFTPTSTLFGVGSASATNGNGNNLVAYCWAPVAGYSAFGSYTGNGSSDGPFVFTGFRPRWVLIKASSAADSWRIYDTARSTYNVAQSQLFPENSNAEITNAAYNFDILSNGFKLRTDNSDFNGSSKTIIYAAFAEAPFQYARAR